jgi:hypothetical protein
MTKVDAASMSPDDWDALYAFALIRNTLEFANLVRARDAALRAATEARRVCDGMRDDC